MRKEQMAAANKLQEILGNKYQVIYDDCESGLTRVFYKTRNNEWFFVKEVLNTEMKSNLSVTDYTLSSEQISFLMATNNL